MPRNLIWLKTSRVTPSANTLISLKELDEQRKPFDKVPPSRYNHSPMRESCISPSYSVYLNRMRLQEAELNSWWKHGCTFSERVKYSGKELMENVTKQCPGLTGLANLGNTCYMNAVLQCLCSLSPLVEYFLSGKYKADLQKENNESVTAFRSLMSDMWYGELDCVSPASFHSVLRKWCPTFSRKTQHDAQEFLICLLNELHEALVKSSNSCVPGAESSTASAGETSIITQLFEGHLSYDITCLKCGTTIKKSDSFTVLSLPIPSKTSCSLQDCLKCFFQCNTLTRSDRVHCFFCGTKQNTAVKGTITKAPQIIIFHLKRFEWQAKRERKLSTDIYYPLSNLDLSPYSSPHLCKDAEYSLCAVVNHYGLLDDGHYTASCKHLVTENWYRFDDANITQIPDHAVQTDKAYLLFYTCQGLF